MDERDTYDALGDDNTQIAERVSWEKATLPVEAEPDEDGEIEEAEGEEEGDVGEDAGEVVEGRELVEAEEDEGSPDALSDLQVAANEEMAKAGLPDFDADAFMAALAESGAEGLALAEADLPAFTSYFDSQIEAGVGAAAIGAGVGWYLKMQAGAEQQRHDADLATRDRMIDELQAQWGRNYENNIFALKRFMGVMPNGVGDAIQAARLADGTLLVNTPGFADTFLQLAKSGARSAPNPKERLAEINDILRTDSQRYFREKLDDEAVQLRRKTEGTTPQSGSAAASASRQLAEISKVLATDPQRYWREDMGKRATELRRQLEQIGAAKASRGQ